MLFFAWAGVAMSLEVILSESDDEGLVSAGLAEVNVISFGMDSWAT
jgi:hypothetical protein